MASINIKDITLTSLETITAFNMNGDFVFTLDELQNAGISQTQDTVDITGKAGRKLASIKRNKGVTVSGTNGLVSAGLLSAQTGGKFEELDASDVNDTVFWTDYITKNNNSWKTTYAAKGTTGAEIKAIYVRGEGGVLGDKYTQVSTTPSGKQFTYSASGNTITFGTEPATGAELVAFYNRAVEGHRLHNDAGTYTETLALYIDALGEDMCGKIYRVQFYVPKADFSGEFNFEMGDNQTVHNFEATALAGMCGTGNDFFTYTVFTEDEPTVQSDEE